MERAVRDSWGQGWRCALVSSAKGAFGGLPTSVGSRGVTVLQVPSCRTNCRRPGGSCQTVGRLVQGPELGRVWWPWGRARSFRYTLEGPPADF